MERGQLLKLFEQGFIPGPEESEETFLSRVQVRASLSFPEWKRLSPTLHQTWGFSLEWVPIHYSSKRLFPWEAAIFKVTGENSPLIQLRPSLQTQNLWTNSRDEILLHEAVHAVREAFDEPRYEEFLAYSANASRFKRWLGPAFEKMWEFPLLAASLFLLFQIPWFFGLVSSFIGARLAYRHLVFHLAKKKVARAVLLCMTDREMEAVAFSKESKNGQRASPRLELMKALTDYH